MFFKRYLTPRAKQQIKRGLRFFHLARRYFNDLCRFARYSSAPYKKYDQAQLDALITLDYHKLEKGMSLNDPRYGFGLKVVAQLQQNLLDYQSRFGVSDVWFEAYSTLKEYYAFNHGKVTFPVGLLDQFSDATERCDEVEYERKTLDGGTKLVCRKDVEEATALDYERFFFSRYSVRDYTNEEVDLNQIMEAAAIAQKAPSVCNRQAGSLYVMTKRKAIMELLAKHGGARGFERNIGKLIVVTASMKAFHFSEERNQPWVDGGIYTMALLNALHSKGLGACCLNWSVAKKLDRWLREKLGVPASSVIICLISVGHFPDQFRVAVSPRKPIERVVTII